MSNDDLITTAYHPLKLGEEEDSKNNEEKGSENDAGKDDENQLPTQCGDLVNSVPVKGLIAGWVAYLNIELSHALETYYQLQPQPSSNQSSILEDVDISQPELQASFGERAEEYSVSENEYERRNSDTLSVLSALVGECDNNDIWYKRFFSSFFEKKPFYSIHTLSLALLSGGYPIHNHETNRVEIENSSSLHLCAMISMAIASLSTIFNKVFPQLWGIYHNHQSDNSTIKDTLLAVSSLNLCYHLLSCYKLSVHAQSKKWQWLYVTSLSLAALMTSMSIGFRLLQASYPNSHLITTFGSNLFYLPLILKTGILDIAINYIATLEFSQWIFSPTPLLYTVNTANHIFGYSGLEGCSSWPPGLNLTLSILVVLLVLAGFTDLFLNTKTVDSSYSPGLFYSYFAFTALMSICQSARSIGTIFSFALNKTPEDMKSTFCSKSKKMIQWMKRPLLLGMVINNFIYLAWIRYPTLASFKYLKDKLIWVMVSSASIVEALYHIPEVFKLTQNKEQWTNPSHLLFMCTELLLFGGVQILTCYIEKTPYPESSMNLTNYSIWNDFSVWLLMLTFASPFYNLQQSCTVDDTAKKQPLPALSIDPDPNDSTQIPQRSNSV